MLSFEQDQRSQAEPGTNNMVGLHLLVAQTESLALVKGSVGQISKYCPNYLRLLAVKALRMPHVLQRDILLSVRGAPWQLLSVPSANWNILGAHPTPPPPPPRAHLYLSFS